MVSRATHYRNKAKHDQRDFGTAKPKLMPREDETIWVPSWRDALAGSAMPYLTKGYVATMMEVTPEEAELKLRKMSSMGLLHMQAYREGGIFKEYRWQLAPAARL